MRNMHQHLRLASIQKISSQIGRPSTLKKHFLTQAWTWTVKKNILMQECVARSRLFDSLRRENHLPDLLDHAAFFQSPGRGGFLMVFGTDGWSNPCDWWLLSHWVTKQLKWDDDLRFTLKSNQTRKNAPKVFELSRWTTKGLTCSFYSLDNLDTWISKAHVLERWERKHLPKHQTTKRIQVLSSSKICYLILTSTTRCINKNTDNLVRLRFVVCYFSSSEIPNHYMNKNHRLSNHLRNFIPSPLTLPKKYLQTHQEHLLWFVL